MPLTHGIGDADIALNTPLSEGGLPLFKDLFILIPYVHRRGFDGSKPLHGKAMFHQAEAAEITA